MKFNWEALTPLGKAVYAALIIAGIVLLVWGLY
jgi:hypothetical protein